MSDTPNNEPKKEESPGGVSTEAILKHLDEKLNALNESVDKKLSSIKQPVIQQQKVETEPEEDIESLIYTNPAKAVAKITKSVESSVRSSVAQETQAKESFASTFNRLAQDYPEISNEQSKLYARAKELTMELSEGRSYDASALERAVFRAANEVGAVPMKLRRQEQNEEGDEGYYSGSSGNNPTKRKKGSEEDLDPKSIAFAQLIGMNVNDPNYIKRLKEINKKRKGNWGKYSS